MPPRGRLPHVFLLALSAMLAGCSSLEMNKPTFRWPWQDQEEPPRAPTKVVVMWTDAVLHQPGQPPRRGFGGRLMFYNEESKHPIKVDGALVIYAFEETGKPAKSVKPDRKYVFTREQLPAHHSKSSLGHSYSVWLPWDEAGGEQKEISLIVRFVPESGPVVLSEQTKHILPGAKPHGAAERGNERTGDSSPSTPTVEATEINGSSREGGKTGFGPVTAAVAIEPTAPTAMPRTERNHDNSWSSVGAIKRSKGTERQVAPAAHEEAADIAHDTAPAGSAAAVGTRMVTTTINMPRTARNIIGATKPVAVGTGSIGPYESPARSRAEQSRSTEERMTCPPGVSTASESVPTTAHRPAVSGPTPQPPHVPRPPQARYSPSRYRVLGAPIARLERDRVGWPPRPEASSSHPAEP
jgi:hypothetical protein